jgi:D-arabinose 1-dehydrogenase-like Zn-dependent alcohol dehydrogenase
MAAMAPDGRLVTCGAHAGEVVPLDIIELFRRGHRILGFRVASPGEIRESLAMALDGRIRMPIARTRSSRRTSARCSAMRSPITPTRSRTRASSRPRPSPDWRSSSRV